MAKNRPQGGRPPGRRGSGGIGPGPGYRTGGTGKGSKHGGKGKGLGGGQTRPPQGGCAQHTVRRARDDHQAVVRLASGHAVRVIYPVRRKRCVVRLRGAWGWWTFRRPRGRY